jgi:hypothetical protein
MHGSVPPVPLPLPGVVIKQRDNFKRDLKNVMGGSFLLGCLVQLNQQ